MEVEVIQKVLEAGIGRNRAWMTITSSRSAVSSTLGEFGRREYGSGRTTREAPQNRGVLALLFGRFVPTEDSRRTKKAELKEANFSRLLQGGAWGIFGQTVVCYPFCPWKTCGSLFLQP